MPVSLKSTVRSIYSFLGFILFAFFASLQTDDITQYGTAAWLKNAWVIGYSIIALLCFYNLLKPLPSRAFLACASLTFILAIFRSTQIDWSNPLFCFTAPKEFAERNPAGNETGGLIIMTIWLLFMWFINRKSESKKP